MNNLDKVKVNGKIFVQNSDEYRKHINPTWKPDELFTYTFGDRHEYQWPRHVLF